MTRELDGDTGFPADGRWGTPVTELREALDRLIAAHPDAKVMVNEVRNLAVMSVDGYYLGFIEIGTEDYDRPAGPFLV